MKYLFPFLILFFLSACEEKPANKPINNTSVNTLTDTIQEVFPKKETPQKIVFDYDTTQWTDLKHLDSEDAPPFHTQSTSSN